MNRHATCRIRGIHRGPALMANFNDHLDYLRHREGRLATPAAAGKENCPEPGRGDRSARCRLASWQRPESAGRHLSFSADRATFFICRATGDSRNEPRLAIVCYGLFKVFVWYTILGTFMHPLPGIYSLSYIRRRFLHREGSLDASESSGNWLRPGRGRRPGSRQLGHCWRHPILAAVCLGCNWRSSIPASRRYGPGPVLPWPRSWCLAIGFGRAFSWGLLRSTGRAGAGWPASWNGGVPGHCRRQHARRLTGSVSCQPVCRRLSRHSPVRSTSFVLSCWGPWSAPWSVPRSASGRWERRGTNGRCTGEPGGWETPWGP